MRTSLCWTKISCTASFLLNHLTKSPKVVINLTKPGQPTSHPQQRLPRITKGLPPDGPREKSVPCETWGLHSILTVRPDLLRPARTGGGREMYNVANSIITDRKMYRFIFKSVILFQRINV